MEMEAPTEIESEVVNADVGEKGTLPYDIIENILLRLPVKHLLRYKSVCKLWKATISDPTFAESHLRHHKNSHSQYLLAWEKSDHDTDLYAVEIQNDHFECVSQIQQHPRQHISITFILCNCDGLYLKCFYTGDERKRYVLWNPSCRAYREIWCPLSIDDWDGHKTCFGIYYNPMVKDYKIVIADTKYYAVFSCRDNKWSETKKINGVSCNNAPYWEYAASFDGSCYWLTNSEGEGGYYDFEIIWFDGKFKKVPLPDFREKPEWLYLNYSGTHLCLFSEENKEIHMSCFVMSIWKRVKDSWMEFKVELEHIMAYSTPPVCWLSENEIMLQMQSDVMFKLKIGYQNYLLYDLSKHTLVEIRRSKSSEHINPVIYHENLFLQ